MVALLGIYRKSKISDFYNTFFHENIGKLEISVNNIQFAQFIVPMQKLVHNWLSLNLSELYLLYVSCFFFRSIFPMSFPSQNSEMMYKLFFVLNTPSNLSRFSAFWFLIFSRILTYSFKNWWCSSSPTAFRSMTLTATSSSESVNNSEYLFCRSFLYKLSSWIRVRYRL